LEEDLVWGVLRLGFDDGVGFAVNDFDFGALSGENAGVRLQVT